MENMAGGIVELGGNLAKKKMKAYFLDMDTGPGKYDGPLFCIGDEGAFLEAVRNGNIKAGQVLLYVRGSVWKKEEQETVQEAVRDMNQSGLGKQVVLLTNQNWLWEERELCNMAIFEEAGEKEDAFWYVRGKDTIAVNRKEKSAYLYVADMEILCRKNEAV